MAPIISLIGGRAKGIVCTEDAYNLPLSLIIKIPGSINRSGSSFVTVFFLIFHDQIEEIVKPKNQ